MAAAILYHHSLEQVTAHKEIVAAVTLANNIAKAMEVGKSTSGLVEFLPHWIYSLLGLDAQHFEYIVTQAKNKYLEFANLLT
ncbi:MAG: hypothetical protein FWG20_01185 [Candidatus Cloacimonetes bacterium]|nr:hypothetical protein [Candidatus Cloacimonadota bacterium]